MKSEARLFCFVYILIWCWAQHTAVFAGEREPSGTVAEQAAIGPSQCQDSSTVALSGVYSPYSVHLVKAEVSGTVVKVNGQEGRILPAGTPVMEIDCSSLEKQLESLHVVLSALEEQGRLLKKNLSLVQRKYDRYLNLEKAGHIEQQLVEDMEAQVNGAQLSLIDNRRRIAETKRLMAEIEDRIKKSRPSFGRPLYVSENFKELYETVVPGEALARLLDTSKAKIHLVLSLSCFQRLKSRMERQKQLDFSIVLEDGRIIRQKGRVEKLKIDPDNRYLYSYGFDLVFPPIKGLLWGQVVKVRLHP